MNYLFSNEQKELNKLLGNNSIPIFALFNKYPTRLITKEAKEMGISSGDILAEFGIISRYYSIYKYGVDVFPEGTNGDFVGSKLKSKKVSKLINRESRFLFGEAPDIIAYIDGKEKTKDEDIKKNVDLCNKLIAKVIKNTKFKSKLLKGAKDCFIGKRVALLANFNEDTGITLNFLKSTNFLYEVNDDNPEILEKFVAFIIVEDSIDKAKQLIFKKVFKMDEGVDSENNKKRMCYIEETLYNGKGEVIEVLTEYTQTELDRIPAVIILNDSLLDDTQGSSEVLELVGGEVYYNKLSNGDMDAQRKEMAQIRYTVDMDADSTSNLSVAPGSYWDLQTDVNKDNPHPAVGTLSSSMNYSNALDTTLKRIDTNMHETIDMPFIDLENLSGVVTSGKGLKAIYWPLILRTKEKMLEWGPALEYIFKLILDAAVIYEDITKELIGQPIVPMDFSVDVVQNFPLPEDEESEKVIDMQEVTAQVMSKKTYIKKWHNLTDDEADEELKQIALERQLLEDSFSDTYVDVEDQIDI